VKSGNRSGIIHSIWAALVALSTVAVTLVGAQPAAAAATLSPVPDTVRKTFRLLTDRQSTFEANGSAIRGVENSGAVTKATPLSVAQSRQHTGRPLCHTTGLNGTYKYNGFCWDTGYDNTSAWSNEQKGGWHPQGLTASHDANPGGTVDGHHLYAASWFYGEGWSPIPAVDATLRDKLARVSIVESTGSDWSYGHVLLVKPTGDESNANFEPVTNVHADGMVWYGNKLFVANGGELQVYDLQHLWKMKASSSRIGIVFGVSSARWHNWALPMVGRYTLGSSSDNARACPGERACLSSLSLDRSGSTDHLVSGEYLTAKDERTAHVIRWPLNDATGLPRADNSGTVTATGAYAVPKGIRQVQGVATDGDSYYLSAQCPDGYMGDSDTSDGYSCIYRAKPGGVPTVLTRSPSLTQNLSYSPSSGRLWGLNELDGKRAVFSLVPTAADGSVYLRNSYSALCAGSGSKIQNGAPAIQWGCNNAQDERWVFESTKDSNGKTAYFIRNEYSGKCMGVRSSLANGARAIQYTCNGAVDEKWWYDSGSGALRNVYSGKCLGLGSAATKGTQLIQWTCNGAADESWTKVPR
jgi:hypothetical protein